MRRLLRRVLSFSRAVIRRSAWKRVRAAAFSEAPLTTSFNPRREHPCVAASSRSSTSRRPSPTTRFTPHPCNSCARSVRLIQTQQAFVRRRHHHSRPRRRCRPLYLPHLPIPRPSTCPEPPCSGVRLPPPLMAFLPHVRELALEGWSDRRVASWSQRSHRQRERMVESATFAGFPSNDHDSAHTVSVISPSTSQWVSAE